MTAFTILENVTGRNGRCFYHRDDLQLEFVPDDAVSEESHPTRFFVIADTLTLAFEAGNGSFYGLDAYTNYERWQHAAVQTAAYCRGRLVLETPPAEGERIDLGRTPRFVYDRVGNRIRVVLEETHGPLKHVKVGENLLSGTVRKRLTELILLNVAWDQGGV